MKLFAITSTRTTPLFTSRVTPAKPATEFRGNPARASHQLPTFHVEAASASEARVKALSVLLDGTLSTTVSVDVQEI